MSQTSFAKILNPPYFVLLTAIFVLYQLPTFADFGNMFGPNSTSGSSSNALPTEQDTSSGRDFTTNCREGAPLSLDRRIANAKKSIEKGVSMMQSCGENHDLAAYKKGKVFKEIGEKDLADMEKQYRLKVLRTNEPISK